MAESAITIPNLGEIGGMPDGTVHARRQREMGVRKLEELAAFQLALQFKQAVYRLVRSHSRAFDDLRYRSQLFDAASSGEANVAEGFERYRAREFCQFLSYARGSIAEARRRVADGVDRGYFTDDATIESITLGRRAGAAIVALQKSLAPYCRPPSRRTRPLPKPPEPKGP